MSLPYHIGNGVLEVLLAYNRLCPVVAQTGNIYEDCITYYRRGITFIVAQYF
jgi:hypothetical protein